MAIDHTQGPGFYKSLDSKNRALVHQLEIEYANVIRVLLDTRLGRF